MSQRLQLYPSPFKLLLFNMFFSVPETSRKATSGFTYCFIPGCHNHEGDTLPDGTPVSLHRLPTAKDRLHIRKQWIRSVQNVRKDIKPITTSSTRICNAHFTNHVVGKYDVPNHFPTANKVRAEVKTRRPITKQQQEESMEVEVTPETPEVIYSDVTQEEVVKQKEMECQTDCSGVDVEIQVGISFINYSADASTQTSPVPDITAEVLECSDEKTRLYTGFVNFAMFMLMFNCLKKHGAEKLNYWDGEKQSMGPKTYHEEGRQKPGRKRRLRAIDEFLMVMMKLRLGLLQEQLGDIFKVSTSTVSRIFNTWINFMFDHCKGLVPYPSAEQIKFNIPRSFHNYPDCQIIIDCTEFFTERPSKLSDQWKTWSEYKHHNTFKLLVGVTPSGMVNYISRLWGGRASDRHITDNDGFVYVLHNNMSVMADKGFTIDDLLPHDIKLNVPPRIPTKRPLTESEFFLTSNIASVRIIVEMKMEQIKNYRYLQGVLPLSEAHLAEQIIYVCTSLTNLLPPLFK